MNKIKALLFLVFWLVGVNVLADDAFRMDLIKRRQAVAKAIDEDAMLILFSAPEKQKTGDVYYEYRQENNFYYLTGIAQEETTLVLMPGNKERSEFIFVKDRDPRTEMWQGKTLSHEEVKEISGIQNVYSNQRFESFINAVLNLYPFDVDRYLPSQEYDNFFEQIKTGQALVYLSFKEKPGLDGELTEEFKFANKLRERFIGITIRDAWPIFKTLRPVKSDFELKMLRHAIDITCDAHLAAGKMLKPGVWEYQVEAVIEEVYKHRNAFDWGFPSIIASGPNATTLHYEASQRQSQAGDLILMDIGAEYQYYSADVTRTFPIEGKFSPEQAAIYQIVYEAQEAAMKLVKPGAKLPDIQKKAAEVVAEGLKRLGLITDASGNQYRMFFPHGSGHWLGMDVHDVGEYRRPFEPGMVFTIEPGIYVRPDALDLLPPTPESEKLKAAIQPAMEKYKNIGVRIEDDVLVTKDGYELLSKKAPRSIEDIEKFLNRTEGM